MTNQGELVNLSQSTQYVSQMTSGNTKKGNMTHWLVNLDTGPGLTFMSQLNSGLDMSESMVKQITISNNLVMFPFPCSEYLISCNIELCIM